MHAAVTAAIRKANFPTCPVCGKRIGLVCVSPGKVWIAQPWHYADLGDGVLTLAHMRCTSGKGSNRSRVRR